MRTPKLLSPRFASLSASRGASPAARLRESERGIGKLTLLVFGAIIVAACYSAYQIMPFYYYFYELQSHMQEAIKVADVKSDDEIRKQLEYQIKWMEIPAELSDLRIVRRERSMEISLPYQEVFYITFRDRDYDLYTFDFNAHAEGSF